MVEAVLERSKGTRREGVLREILGKGLVAGVAAMSAFSYSGNSNADTVNQSLMDSRSNITIIVFTSTRPVPTGEPMVMKRRGRIASASGVR